MHKPPRRMHTSTGRLLFARRYPQGRRANFGVFSIPEPTGQERTHRTALKTMILSPQRLRDRSFFYRMRLMAPDFRPKTSMQAPSTAENSQKCTPRPTPGERQPKKRARPLFGCNYGKALTANKRRGQKAAHHLPYSPVTSWQGMQSTRPRRTGLSPGAFHRTKEPPPHVVRSGGSFMSEDAPGDRPVRLSRGLMGITKPGYATV